MEASSREPARPSAQGIGGLASIGSGIFNLARGGGSTSSMVSGDRPDHRRHRHHVADPWCADRGAPDLAGRELCSAASLATAAPRSRRSPALVYGAGQFGRPTAGGYSYTGDSLGSGTAMAAERADHRDRPARRRSAPPASTVVPCRLDRRQHRLGHRSRPERHPVAGPAYTQTGLILPGGGYEALTYNDCSRGTSPRPASTCWLRRSGPTCCAAV